MSEIAETKRHVSSETVPVGTDKDTAAKEVSLKYRLSSALSFLVVNLIVEFAHRPRWASWWSIFAITATSAGIFFGRRSQFFWFWIGLALGAVIGAVLDMPVFRH